MLKHRRKSYGTSTEQITKLDGSMRKRKCVGYEYDDEALGTGAAGSHTRVGCKKGEGEKEVKKLQGLKGMLVKA